MVDRERVVRMTFQYLLKALYRAVIVEIVEALEGGGIQRIKGARLGEVRRHRGLGWSWRSRCLSSSSLRSHGLRQECSNQREQHGCNPPSHHRRDTLQTVLHS